MSKPLLLCVTLFAVSAQAQNFISGIEPHQGPVSGGTRVVVTGDFRIEPITSPPCIGAQAYIGGRQAEVVAFTTERVEIVAPPYTPGRFDVTVSRCGVDAVQENGFIYGDVIYERALLPVVLAADVPGAFDSLWRTEIVGLNLSGNLVTSQPHLPCHLPFDCPGFTNQGRFVPTFPASTAGVARMLYVRGDSPRWTHLTLRVRDVSREQESLGTELPVVWEDDAYGPSTTFAISDLPRGPLYRSKLRLYRVDTAEPAALEVRIHDESSAIVAYRTVVLSGGRQEGTFLLQPPYAELDLDGLFGLAPGGRWLAVQTPGEGLYWGFVSVTNNVTQQITTVSP